MSFVPKRTAPSPEELELARILSLPVVYMLTPDELEFFSFDHMLGEAYDRGERLRLEQASAMRAYLECDGGLFPLSVGKGKSGVALFAANEAYKSGVRKILLLMESQNVRGMMKHHVPQWRKLIDLVVPFHFLAGRDRRMRRRMCENNSPGCYVMPYSLLSQSDAAPQKQDDGTMDPGNLNLIGPELVIADEVHNLRNARVARTKRVMTYLRDAGPQFIGMSGTITQKSLMDYWHLISAALGDASPLPRTHSIAVGWDQIINAEAERPTEHAKKLMGPLIRWARDKTGESFNGQQIESYRRAFRHRLVLSPGVVSSAEDDLGVSLRFLNQEVEGRALTEGWTELDRLMDDVDGGETPQGEEIAHAFHKFKWQFELSAGFYNALNWPTPATLSKSRKIELDKAAHAIEDWQTHHEQQQEYYRLLRAFFRTSVPGLDTPREVGRAIAMKDKRIPSDLREAWEEMKELERIATETHEFQVKRGSTPIRVCSYKVDHAVAWAQEAKFGIIWVWHQELGRWIVEALKEVGLEPLYCPSGSKHDEAIEAVGNPQLGGKGDRIVVASLRAHGTGKNLQAFNKVLFPQWPRSGKDAEQTVGRVHRHGQVSDSVEVHTCLSTEHDHLVMAACLNDAIYVQQTTGAPQRMVFGDYDPLPHIYTEEFLREQGIEDVRSLSEEGRRIRAENFGTPSK